MSEAKRTNLFMLIVILNSIFAVFLYSGIVFWLGNLGITVSTAAGLVLSQLLTQAIPFVLYMAHTKKKLTEVLPLKNPGLANIGLIILMAILIQPIMSFLSAFTSLFFKNNVSATVISMYTSRRSTIIGIMIISILPAVFEEFVYRGIILSGYKKAPLALKVLASGLFFGIMHMNPHQFLYAFVLGCVFALVVHYSGSIFSSMLFHFLVNFTQSMLAAILMKFSQSLPESAEIAASTTEGSSILAAIIFTGIIAAIFVPLFALVFVGFISHNKRCNAHEVLQEADEIEEKFKIKRVFDTPFFAVIIIFISFVFLQYFAY